MNRTSVGIWIPVLIGTHARFTNWGRVPESSHLQFITRRRPQPIVMSPDPPGASQVERFPADTVRK